MGGRVGLRYGRIGGQREKVKTKGFIKPLALGGSTGFVESLTLLRQRLNAHGGEGVGKGGV
jgi:hypothetical protein